MAGPGICTRWGRLPVLRLSAAGCSAMCVDVHGFWRQQQHTAQHASHSKRNTS